MTKIVIETEVDGALKLELELPETGGMEAQTVEISSLDYTGDEKASERPVSFYITAKLTDEGCAWENAFDLTIGEAEVMRDFLTSAIRFQRSLKKVA